MARSKQATVDEVLDSLARQGFLVIDARGNCFARPLHDTGSPYPHLIWGVQHSPVPTDKQKEQTDDDTKRTG